MMKNKKLLSLAMTFTMLATSAIGAMSVKAEDVLKGKGNITTGFDLVYNESKSSETTRVIDVYVNGIDSIATYTLRASLAASNGSITSPNSNPQNKTWDWTDFQPAFGTTSFMYMNGTVIASGTDNSGTYTQVFNGGYMGSLVINVSGADAEFTATVASQSSIKKAVNGALSGTTIEFDTLTIPAFATAPVVPEPPADTRSDFEAADAKKIGRYDADKTSVPVDAWLAEIDYSAVKLAEGASLAWKVNVSDETIDVANDTTVSGQASVFYGLAIAGRADQLDTITTVQLIAE